MSFLTVTCKGLVTYKAVGNLDLEPLDLSSGPAIYYVYNCGKIL